MRSKLSAAEYDKVFNLICARLHIINIYQPGNKSKPVVANKEVISGYGRFSTFYFRKKDKACN
jgi:hypothetical protein